MDALKATMGLEARGFTSAVEHVKGSLGELKEKVNSVAEMSKIGDALKVLGVSFAAFKGVEGIGESFKGIFEAGKELQAQSRAYGESITSLMTLKKAYQEVGMDAGSLGGNLTMLRAALGGVNQDGEPTKKVFEQLGLSVNELKGKTAVEQFTAIGRALGQLATQEDKVAAVRAIFGRQGGEMLNILGDPRAIEEAAEMVAEKAKIYEQNASLFKQVTNEFEAVGQKVSGFFLGAASSAATELSPVLEELKSIDTVKMGEDLGKSLGHAIEHFKQDFTGSLGELGKLLLETMAIGFDPSVLKNLTLSLTNAAKDFGFSIKDSVLGIKKNETPQDVINRGGWRGAAASLWTGAEGVAATSAQMIDKGVRFDPKTLLSLGINAASGNFLGAFMDSVKLQNEKVGSGVDYHVETPGEATARIRGTKESDAQANASVGDDPFKKLLERLDALFKEKIQGSALFQGKDRPDYMAREPEPQKKPGEKKPEATGAMSKGGKAEDIERSTDRLARIGGLIAGGTRDMADARATANNTGATAKALNQMIQSGIKIISPVSTGGEAYA